jgi:hypothetical protein
MFFILVVFKTYSSLQVFLRFSIIFMVRLTHGIIANTVSSNSKTENI